LQRHLDWQPPGNCGRKTKKDTLAWIERVNAAAGKTIAEYGGSFRTDSTNLVKQLARAVGAARALPPSAPRTRGTTGRMMTDQDTNKAAALRLLKRGLVTQSEAANLAGVSRQLMRHWARDIPKDARDQTI
jgi:hypothetical protein